MTRAMLAAPLLAFCLAAPTAAQEKPVRIASGVAGHIHPALCLTKKGTLVVIFSQSNYKDLRQTTSTDGGIRPSRNDLRHILKQGIPGTSMPTFVLLGDEKIDLLVEYVRFLAMRGEYERRLVQAISEFASSKAVAEAAKEKPLQDVETEIAARLKDEAEDLFQLPAEDIADNWTRSDLPDDGPGRRPEQHEAPAPQVAPGLVERRSAQRVTLPALRQEVHTFSRFGVPLTTARTRWMFGSKRRFVRRCECDTLWPKPGPLAQMSQTAATVSPEVMGFARVLLDEVTSPGNRTRVADCRDPTPISAVRPVCGCLTRRELVPDHAPGLRKLRDGTT